MGDDLLYRAWFVTIGAQGVTYMNKALIGVLVIVVGGLVGWYVIKGGVGNMNTAPQQEAQNTPTISPADTGSDTTVVTGVTTVEYTDNGFSPKTITVKKGTKVTFTNNSSTSMWVASDVHPTHQLLPGFDELTSAAKGGSYAYTFAKVGTWTYHNHVNPTMRGTVVVTE